MSVYTEELQKEIERVTLRGNADKDTIRKLSSIIFRMDTRLNILENEIVVDDKPIFEAPAPEVKEEPKSQGKTVRAVSPKASETKSKDETPSDTKTAA